MTVSPSPLEALRESFLTADYRPLSAELIRSTDILMARSPAVRALFDYLVPPQNEWGGRRWADLIPLEPWGGSAHSLYDALDEDQRCEALGLLTFDLHELTHHVISSSDRGRA